MNTQRQKGTRSIPLANTEFKQQKDILGPVDFEWPYIVATYRGECSMPEKLNIFEETICRLLSEDPDLPMSQIGNILGLDIDNDLAGKEVLLKAIGKLKKDGMVDGDESMYWITELGKKSLKEGTKNATYTKPFELFIDALGNVRQNAKKIFSSLEHYETSGLSEDHIPESIEDVRAIAEWQAPEIHYPKKNYILQKCFLDEDKNPIGYKALVRVALIRNDKTDKLKVLVMDRKKGHPIDELSDALNQLGEQKHKLYNQIIQNKNVKI